MGAGTALLGEDAQLNRETTAILRGQQLNQTNLAREGNAQAFKVAMAGRMKSNGNCTGKCYGLWSLSLPMR